MHSEAHKDDNTLVLGLIVINEHCEAHNNGIMISEFSKALRISKPAGTLKINDYERKKLIVKMQDQFDKRKTYIVLTQKGKDLVEEKHKKIAERFDKFAECYTETEFWNFIEYFERLINYLDQRTEKNLTYEREKLNG